MPLLDASHQLKYISTQLLLCTLFTLWKGIKVYILVKAYITGLLNMQTILTLCRVYADYTGYNMKKINFLYSSIYPCYSKQPPGAVWIKTNMNLVSQDIRLSNIK